MSQAMGWWIAGGLLVAAELATGTFYLLMLAAGCAAAAVAAHVGFGLQAQTLCAAVVGVVATAAWHWRGAKRGQDAPTERNRDVNLDIGQRLTVVAWQADGTARVQYRGAGWTARFEGAGPPTPGEYKIVSIQGNQLGLAPVMPV